MNKRWNWPFWGGVAIGLLAVGSPAQAQSPAGAPAVLPMPEVAVGRVEAVVLGGSRQAQLSDAARDVHPRRASVFAERTLEAGGHRPDAGVRRDGRGRVGGGDRGGGRHGREGLGLAHGGLDGGKPDPMVAERSGARRTG